MTEPADLPVAILRSPALTLAEWGWRRLLAEWLGPTLSGSAEAENPAVVGHEIVQSLRQALDEAARLPEQGHWVTRVSASSDQPQLVPFAHLSSTDVGTLESDVVRAWLLLDRFASAVQEGASPTRGGGMVTVPAEGPPGSTRALRWQAQTYARADADGRPAYRIVFDLRVQEEPVRVTIWAQKPELSVHLESQNRRLQERAMAAQGELGQVLRGLGWDLRKMTASEFAPEQE
ncbi:MAG: hypothetical protein K6T78_07700 [Alicyclobacillus sp.]|nr:hypothetical protein [Alicyclobacillus sp.]